MSTKEGLEPRLPDQSRLNRDQKENSAPSTETPLLNNVILKCFLSQVGKKVAMALAAAGTVLLANALDNSIPATLADIQKTPTPTPLSRLSAEGMPSQKDIREQTRLLLQTGEIRQNDPGNIEFNIGTDNYMWDVSNAYWGIYPPNDPDIGTGTVRVRLNGIWTKAKSFQGLLSLAPRPPIVQGIVGIAINIPLDKYYLSEVVLRGDGNYDPYFELGSDIKNAEKYLGRTTIWKGLPQGGLKGYAKPVTLGTDTNGNYANITYFLDYPYTEEIHFTDCIIVTECGTYQIRLDNQGNFIGDTFVKLPDVQPSPTATVPSPTATTQPTIEATSVVVEPTPGNMYTATLSSNLAGVIIPAEAAGSSLVKAEVHQSSIPADLPPAILPLSAIDVSFSRNGTNITELASNATVQFSYNGYNLDERQIGTLTIYNSTRREYLPVSINQTTKIVSAKTNRFSTFTLARAIAPIPRLLLPLTNR